MSELRKGKLLMLGLPFAHSYKFQGSKVEIRKKMANRTRKVRKGDDHARHDDSRS